MISLSKIKLQIPDFEWVSQVSILRPGFLLAMGSRPEHPGLKIETWATHSIFVRVIFWKRDCLICGLRLFPMEAVRYPIRRPMPQ
jgi:hypothetical protein